MPASDRIDTGEEGFRARPNSGGPTIAARFLRWLNRFLARHLPAVLVIGAVVQLIHSCTLFAITEEVAAKLVSAVRSPDLQSPNTAKVVSVVLTAQLHESIFHRRLPLDRAALAGVVDRLVDACPAALALDVDVAPEVSQNEPGFKALEAAILRALERGVSVVGVTLRRNDAQARRERNAGLKRLCELNRRDAATPRSPQSCGAQEKAKFSIASPQLLKEKLFGTVLRYRRPAENQVPQLGQALAVAAGLKDAVDIDAACNALTPANGSSTPDPGAADRLDALLFPDMDGIPARERPHIRYLWREEPGIGIESVHDLDAPLDLEGKAVVVGFETFSGVDQHETPVGEAPGALIHAFIARSAQDSMEDEPLLAYALDTALGLLLVSAMLLAAYISNRVGHARPHTAYVLRVLFALAILLLVFGVTLFAAVYVWGHGLWIHPLPVLIALIAHQLIEGLESGHTGDRAHPDPERAQDRALYEPESLTQWFGETAKFVSNGRVSDQSLLVVSRLACALLILVGVGWAAYHSFSH